MLRKPSFWIIIYSQQMIKAMSNSILFYQINYTIIFNTTKVFCKKSSEMLKKHKGLKNSSFICAKLLTFFFFLILIRLVHHLKAVVVYHQRGSNLQIPISSFSDSNILQVFENTRIFVLQGVKGLWCLICQKLKALFSQVGILRICCQE